MALCVPSSYGLLTLAPFSFWETLPSVSQEYGNRGCQFFQGRNTKLDRFFDQKLTYCMLVNERTKQTGVFQHLTGPAIFYGAVLINQDRTLGQKYNNGILWFIFTKMTYLITNLIFIKQEIICQTMPKFDFKTQLLHQ